MTLVGFLIMLVIAAICGALGQALAGWSVGGLFASIAVGFIGAYLGVWLAGQLKLPELWTIQVEGESFPIVWSIIGGALFTFIVSLFQGRGGRRRRRI